MPVKRLFQQAANQYVPGSKPFGEQERKIAFTEDDHDFPIAVRKSYPLLIQRGHELTNQGVQFHDLTMLYQNEEQVLYRDWCCHVNSEGYDLVAEAIAQEIMSALKGASFQND